MNIPMIGEEDVYRLLPMQECIALMAETLKLLAQQKASNPLRQVMWLPDRRGLLGIMPGSLEDEKIMGLKAISIFPGNQDSGLDSHQGMILLFETRTGRPLAIVDASSITALRTAAVSGVATQLLARPEAGNLAILGSGVQAKTHLQAMRIVRKIQRIRVWSRNFDHAQKFARNESRRHGVDIEAVGSARQAVEGADIICTVTAATEPVLKGAWISPGTHINAVGSSTPFARELDTEAVARAKLFVDRRESTVNEAGDFLIPKQQGAVGDDHIRAEIGELLLGEAQGRSSTGDVTLFKSLGLAVEDLAAANAVYQKLYPEKSAAKN